MRSLFSFCAYLFNHVFMLVWMSGATFQAVTQNHFILLLHFDQLCLQETPSAGMFQLCPFDTHPYDCVFLCDLPSGMTKCLRLGSLTPVSAFKQPFL